MANTKHQNKRKFHTVYQATNLINNKIYVGAHSTDELDDNYYGSGTNIARAIEKYGSRNGATSKQIKIVDCGELKN